MLSARSVRFWLSVLVSVVLLWLALRGLDLGRTVAALREADYRWLPPALVLYFLGVWVRAWRWRALLAPVGSYSTRSLFPVVIIGYMANDVLPARMGEIVRVYVLSQREGLPKTVALGTVVVERLLDALTMLLLLAVAALSVPLNGVVERVALVAGGVLLVALWPLLFAVLWPDRVTRLGAPVAARLPRSLTGRLSGAVEGFLAGLRVVRSPQVVLAGFGFSVVAWLLEAGMYLTLARAFDLPLGVPLTLMTLAVANLATLVPAAPGYVGTFHVGALAVLVGLAGLDPERAAGYVLLLHAALVVPVVLWGVLLWGRHNLSLGRIRREAHAHRPPERTLSTHRVD